MRRRARSSSAPRGSAPHSRAAGRPARWPRHTAQPPRALPAQPRWPRRARHWDRNSAWSSASTCHRAPAEPCCPAQSWPADKTPPRQRCSAAKRVPVTDAVTGIWSASWALLQVGRRDAGGRRSGRAAGKKGQQSGQGHGGEVSAEVRSWHRRHPCRVFVVPAAAGPDAAIPPTMSTWCPHGTTIARSRVVRLFPELVEVVVHPRFPTQEISDVVV